MLSAILSIEKKEKLCAKIYHLDKNLIEINYALFQTLKQKLAKIFQSKKKLFCIKAIIRKFEKDAKYTLPNFHIQAN